VINATTAKHAIAVIANRTRRRHRAAVISAMLIGREVREA
jgi:hypothetical protein